MEKACARDSWGIDEIVGTFVHCENVGIVSCGAGGVGHRGSVFWKL